MSTEQNTQNQTPANPVEVECPKCGHKFFHKIREAIKGAIGVLGDAIGEAKFGDQR